MFQGAAVRATSGPEPISAANKGNEKRSTSKARNAINNRWKREKKDDDAIDAAGYNC